MKKYNLQEIILSELKEVKADVKELREKDLPQLKVDIAIEKERSSKAAKIITIVGGGLAIATSTAVAWLVK